MSEEKKDLNKVDKEKKEIINELDQENSSELDDNDSVDLFFNDEDSKVSNKGETEDLPEEIKQKLEKNKQARAKKKLSNKKRKKKEFGRIRSGNAYITATYNNTIISLSDKNGNIISWASAGMAGFKGAKKATPYAAQIIAKIAVLKAKEEYGLEEVNVFVAGVGTGRESAIRALNANGLDITAIKDVTSVPHNGCRAKKPRRV